MAEVKLTITQKTALIKLLTDEVNSGADFKYDSNRVVWHNDKMSCYIRFKNYNSGLKISSIRFYSLVIGKNTSYCIEDKDMASLGNMDVLTAHCSRLVKNDKVKTLDDNDFYDAFGIKSSLIEQRSDKIDKIKEKIKQKQFKPEPQKTRFRFFKKKT